MGMKGTGTPYTLSLGGLCASVLYKLPSLYRNELGVLLRVTCPPSTIHCDTGLTSIIIVVTVPHANDTVLWFEPEKSPIRMGLNT